MNYRISEDIFKEFDEQQRIDMEYNEILASYRFVDFKKKHSLVFIGYDYYPPHYDGEKVYTFVDVEGNFTRVFNLTGISIGQILVHGTSFSVVRRRTGYYELLENGVSLNVKKEIMVAFEDEWLEYEEIKEKQELTVEKRKRKEEVQRQQERNANRFPYDLSGDDLSLDPNMW